MTSSLRALLLAALFLGLGGSARFARAGDAKKDPPKKEEPKKDDDKPKKDPKDMNADEAEAAGLCPIKKGPSKPVYHCDYNGTTYHFCSRECQKTFAADPAKYAGPPKKKDEKKDDKK